MDFFINEYSDIIEKLDVKYEGLFSSLKQILIRYDNKFEVYVYEMRIVIPECHINIREGIIYDKEDEDFCEEAFVVYGENEKDAKAFREIYSNTDLVELVCEISGKDNVTCFIDETEFVFWDER